MPIRSGKKTKSIGYSTLLELDRFLSGRLGVSVGMVLAKSHRSLHVTSVLIPNGESLLEVHQIQHQSHQTEEVISGST